MHALSGPAAVQMTPLKRAPEPKGVLSVFASALLFPFDPVLSGMIAADQGITAICLLLNVTREDLYDHLVRLDLRTPQDRPLRKPASGKGNGWTVEETRALIAWRAACVHPQSIADRLGRSVFAIRAKSRRLGLPTPKRKDLRRFDPASLRFPDPRYAFLPVPIYGAPLADEPARTGHDKSARETAGASSNVVPVHESSVAPDAPAGKPARAPSRPALPLLRSLPGGGATNALPAPIETTREPIAIPAGSSADSPPPELPRDNPLDLRWIRFADGWRENPDIVRALVLRYFAGQHYASVAAEIGVSPGTVQSFYWHIEIPRDRSRARFSRTFVYDHEFARNAFAVSGFEIAKCKARGLHFVRKISQRGSVTLCRAARKARGIEETDRWFRLTVTLPQREQAVQGEFAGMQ